MGIPFQYVGFLGKLKKEESLPRDWKGQYMPKCRKYLDSY